MPERLLAAALLLAATGARAAVVSEPDWIVPSARNPYAAETLASNNNVALARHGGRLYMAWRTAPIHFASERAALHVISSGDLGKTWRAETTVRTGRDLREPSLVSWRGRLRLYCLELGKNAFAFEPRRVLRLALDRGRWSEPVEVPELAGEVPWEVKAESGKVWATSYSGRHYKMLGASEVQLRRRVSDDGLRFRDPGPEGSAIYSGGLSEASVAETAAGVRWLVARNEDGDASGFGSRVARSTGPAESWTFAPSDPRRLDSPRLFRGPDGLYLLARLDPGRPFDWAWRRLPLTLRRLLNLARYSLTPKRSALYKLDEARWAFDLVAELPGASDTAFPAVVALGGGRFLVANYSSPLPDAEGWSWLRGQVSRRGTGLYLVTLDLGPAR
jgi:hypothetical protein